MGFGASVATSGHIKAEQEALDRKLIRIRDNNSGLVRQLRSQYSDVASKLDLLKRVCTHLDSEHRRINREQVEMANQINELIRGYKVEFITDEYDRETKGKPCITWTNPLFADNGSTNIMLATLIAEEVRAEFMICSGSGSIHTENILNNTNIIYKDVLAPTGEFIDRSVKADETIIYYLLIMIKYRATRKNDNETYRAVTCEVESILETRRITVPQYQSVEKVVDDDISRKTAKIKHEKFRQKYEKMMADISGDSADPEQATKAVLDNTKSRLERKRIEQKMLVEIQQKGEDMGLSEEEIEEMIEEFLLRME